MKMYQSTGRCLAAAAMAVVIPASAMAQSDQNQAMQKDPVMTAVSINDIEANTAKYTGKVVKVTGEVDEVLGPRMFKIDEREWLDFDGETLVYVPAPLAALVSEGAPVTVTGTLRNVMDVDLTKEWGWFELEPDIEAEFDKRPVIVATSVASREGLDLAIRIDANPDTPVGTSGSARPMLTDAGMLAQSDDEMLVGRRVNLQKAKVASVAKEGGFWVNVGTDTLFVLPARAGAMKITPGQTVSVSGVVLEMPDGMNDRVADRKVASDEEIYVYATDLEHMQ